MSKRILVTGGAGFIGHHLVKALLEYPNLNVAVVDNLSNSNPNFRNEEFRDVAFYREDIRNKEAIVDIIRRENIGTCIHLAAKISVAESLVDPSNTVDVNVNGTLSVIAACAENNVQRFVFASSAAVYGESRTLPIVENQELNPLSPYGVTKVAGEWLVNSYNHAGKIPYAISLRFFNVYGVGQSPEYAGVITRFAERLSQGLPPIIHGRGVQTRDFVTIDDVVSAIIMASEAELSGTFNIGTGIPTSISDLARRMLLLYGLDLAPEHQERMDGDILYSYADISKAKKVLKFFPSNELYETLEVMLRPTHKKAKIVTN
ncbi:MAG: NAD-dependent epimerase/dehydratase family protein [Nitrososphaera sp.]